MIWEPRFGLIEPEVGNLGENLSFQWDAIGKDTVKGGDAICGDEQQGVAEIEYLANFAGPEFRETRQIDCQ